MCDYHELEVFTCVIGPGIVADKNATNVASNPNTTTDKRQVTHHKHKIISTNVHVHEH